MIWDNVTTFLKDVAETYYWDVVGYFIWDVPAASLGRTDRRHLDVVTTSFCWVGHIVACRDCKHFDNEKFRSEIQNCASEKKLKWFKETVFCILKKHAPFKRKNVSYDEAAVLTKELHKAMMKRSRLGKKFLKTKLITERKNYNVQWNCCKKLLRASKNHILWINT